MYPRRGDVRGGWGEASLGVETAADDVGADGVVEEVVTDVAVAPGVAPAPGVAVAPGVAPGGMEAPGAMEAPRCDDAPSPTRLTDTQALTVSVMARPAARPAARMSGVCRHECRADLPNVPAAVFS
jgi:hypothetical protein